MRKRSITIAGHQTSITLEDAFWEELKELARRENLTIQALVTRIDNTRDIGTTNLSSALRLYVLESLRRDASFSEEHHGATKD